MPMTKMEYLTRRSFNNIIFLYVIASCGFAYVESSNGTCNLPLSNRSDCGFIGIDKDHCENVRHCCFKEAPSGSNAPWCYYNKELNFQLRKFQVCEHEEKKTLSCSDDNVINIFNGFFGYYPTSKCHHICDPKTVSSCNFCTNVNSTDIASTLCNCKSSCVIDPKHKEWLTGTECDKFNNLLEIQYVCVPKTSNSSKCSFSSSIVVAPSGSTTVVRTYPVSSSHLVSSISSMTNQTTPILKVTPSFQVSSSSLKLPLNTSAIAIPSNASISVKVSTTGQEGKNGTNMSTNFVNKRSLVILTPSSSPVMALNTTLSVKLNATKIKEVLTTSLSATSAVPNSFAVLPKSSSLSRHSNITSNATTKRVSSTFHPTSTLLLNQSKIFKASTHVFLPLNSSTTQQSIKSVVVVIPGSMSSSPTKEMASNASSFVTATQKTSSVRKFSTIPTVTLTTKSSVMLSSSIRQMISPASSALVTSIGTSSVEKIMVSSRSSFVRLTTKSSSVSVRIGQTSFSSRTSLQAKSSRTSIPTKMSSTEKMTPLPTVLTSTKALSKSSPVSLSPGITLTPASPSLSSVVSSAIAPAGKKPKKNKLSTAAKIAIIASVVIILLVILVVIVLCYRKRSTKRQFRYLDDFSPAPGTYYSIDPTMVQMSDLDQADYDRDTRTFDGKDTNTGYDNVGLVNDGH